MSNEPTVAKETVDILGMFAVMKRSYDALSDDDKRKVDSALEGKARFGFEGFDTNNDRHAFVARDLARQGTLDEYGEIKDWVVLESHTATSITLYRRMLSRYLQLRRDDLQPGNSLTAEQIIQIMWSRLVTSSGSKAN